MKAISAIIVVILFLMISVSLAAFSYMFFTTVFSRTTEAGEEAVTHVTTSILSKMVIESISADNIYVRNNGGTNLTGFTVYVDGEMANFSAPSVILPGEIGTIDISLCPGKIEVTTTQGAKDIKNFVDSNMIFCLKFEEGSGLTAKDSINGLNVNLIGNWIEGKFGGGFEFTTSATTNLGGIGNGVTYTLWFKLPDLTDLSGTIFCAEDVADASEDNLGQTNYGDRGCGVGWYNAGFNVNDVNWHKYKFVKSSNSVLCLDGNCVNVGDASANIPNIDRVRFNIGCGCGYGGFNQGIIVDEVKIYK